MVVREEPRKDQAYRGYVAGVFSGIAKLAVGHPFDTIKVRLQTSQTSRFSGPIDCLLQTLHKEGLRGVYKGATPPLVGWMAMDSIMLGTLNLNRQLLRTHFFPVNQYERLPSYAHGIAGIGAGLVVSFIAAPVEHIKARLQVQYHNTRSLSSSSSSPTVHKPKYTGPLDCTAQLYRLHGIPGIYRGLFATMLFRSAFFFWWSSYDLLDRYLASATTWSKPAINFVAGGVSAQVFWICAYPADVVKQRVMTSDGVPKRWLQAAKEVRQIAGWRGFWRGFTPCFLRAFPANAAALMVFEAVVRQLP